MKRFKVFAIAAILGLSIGLFPNASFADDVRLGVGFFLGLPVPILTVDNDGPYYRHEHGYAYGQDYRGYYDHGYRHEYYGHRGYYGQGDYGRRGYGHGDFGRGGNRHGDHGRGHR